MKYLTHTRKPALTTGFSLLSRLVHFIISTALLNISNFIDKYKQSDFYFLYPINKVPYDFENLIRPEFTTSVITSVQSIEICFLAAFL